MRIKSKSSNGSHCVWENYFHRQIIMVTHYFRPVYITNRLEAALKLNRVECSYYDFNSETIFMMLKLDECQLLKKSK